METLASIIESILFVSGDAVAIKDISEKLGLSDKEVLKIAEKLQKEKYNADSGIHLLIFNKKLQFGTNKNNAESVATVLNPIKERELSRSMLEVAAIIAYKQPVTRMDLEDIRNCSCEYALQNLLKLGVVEVVGRKDTIGHPALFGTTDNFLKRFQISSLDELPDYEGLIDKIKQLHGGDDDAYLFKKDVYNEENDPEYQNQSFDGAPAEKPQDVNKEESSQSENLASNDAESGENGESGSIFDAVDNTFSNSEESSQSDDKDETPADSDEVNEEDEADETDFDTPVDADGKADDKTA